jgi:hypothetical protein
VFGIVLSFDPAHGGLLLGEDRKRYAFDPQDWKSEAAPVVGRMADFEPEGARARNLYLLPARDAAVPPRPFFLDRPGIPLGLLILIACIFPFLTLGPFSANLFNVVGTAASLGDYAPANVNMETGLWLFHFLYIVPACALALVVLEWRGLAGRWLRIGTGLIGLLAPVAIALGARALFTTNAHPHLSLGTRLLRRVGEVVAPDLFVPHIGMGWIALALLSLALVCVGLFAPAVGPGAVTR